MSMSMSMSSLMNDLPETTTRESLINQLQIIWDELGEFDSERAKMLFQLQKEYSQQQQQECRLEVYKRKLDQAYRHRATLKHSISLQVAKLAEISYALGFPIENRFTTMLQSNSWTLKEKYAAINLRLREMREIKRKRKSQFDDVRREHIRLMSGSTTTFVDVDVDDESETTDLSLGQLHKLQTQLHSLHDDLKNQLPGIMDTLLPLCHILGLSYDTTHEKADPPYIYLDSKPGDHGDITKGTIHKLTATIHQYQELKKHNMEKFQRLATKMLDLWDFLATPDEEQLMFQHFRRYVAAAYSEDEMTEPGILSSENLYCVEMEVARLQALKSIRCGKKTETSHLTDLGTEEVDTYVLHLIHLATTIVKLWDALDTPIEERKLFQQCSLFVQASKGKITQYVVPKRFLVSLRTEAYRLELMRSSIFKGKVLKKKLEFEKICKETDVFADSYDGQWDEYIRRMDAGHLSPIDLSDKLDSLIAIAEKFRCINDIRSSVKEWLLAQEEVSWLKAYERDSNRYNAGSANRTLERAEEAPRAVRARAERACSERAHAERARVEKDRAERAHAEKARSERAHAERAPAEKARAEKARAERAHAEKARAKKARALAIQLPAMVKVLDSKATRWEKKFGDDLTYNGIRVRSLLKEHAILKRKRKPDQKEPLPTSSKTMRHICTQCQMRRT